MFRSITLLVALCLAASLPWTVSAQDPAAFYDEHCAGCHTIGQGPNGGPDLRGVTSRRDREWLVRFLLDPYAFASDPAVVQMIKEADGLEMGPTEGLTRDMADALLGYIDEQSAAAAGPAAAPFAALTPDERLRGRVLFNGTVRLSGGGPSCVACHSGGDITAADAGRLGVDLAGAHERLGGARGLTAWLKATPTPMMHALYGGARLTEGEARALAAFIETPGAAEPPRRALAPHVIGGVAGALLLVWMMALSWSQRLRAVRRPLVQAFTGKGATRHIPSVQGGAR